MHIAPAWTSDRVQIGARCLLLVAGRCLSVVEAQCCLAAQLFQGAAECLQLVAYQATPAAKPRD